MNKITDGATSNNSRAQARLEGCPFCGGEAQLVTCRGGEDSMLARVNCKTCGAQTDEFEDAFAPINQAVSEWNRRISALSTPACQGEVGEPLAPSALRLGEDARICTCHPDDAPKGRCRRKYALSECIKDHLVEETVECLTDLIEDKTYEIEPWVCTCLRGIRQNVKRIADPQASEGRGSPPHKDIGEGEPYDDKV